MPLVQSPAAPTNSKAPSGPPVETLLERARRYVSAIPPAVAGNGGDAATFRVCCRLARGFALDDDDALDVLTDWNNACVPPWSQDELRAKLRGARLYGREPVGGLVGTHRSSRPRSVKANAPRSDSRTDASNV